MTVHRGSYLADLNLAGMQDVVAVISSVLQ
jgi:hypothetical protein